MADESGADTTAQDAPPAQGEHAVAGSPWADAADVAPVMLVLRLWTEARAVARSAGRVEHGTIG